MEYYSDIKKNKIVNVWSNHSSKVTQIQKEKYYMVFFLSMGAIIKSLDTCV